MDRCKVCNKEFRRKYRRGGQRKIYCSKSCRYKGNYVTKQCPTCGSTFRTNTLSRRKDYCSVACIQRPPCQLCGKTITGRNKFRGGERRFCGRRCASIANKTIEGIKNYVVKGFTETIRRIGKIACEECGFDNPDGLVVHHVDHDRSNNSPENLKTLCGTCHALAHWSGSVVRRRIVLIAQFLAKHT